MSSHVDPREIVVNMMCVEKGIIPFLGMDAAHIADTLENVSDHDRRVIVRKFRKILKKAIQHEAATWCNINSTHYLKRIEKLRLSAGLGKGKRGTSSKKMSMRQHLFRRTLVARYLAMMAEKIE